jgi:predicted AAA+ superfamily ATPase
MEVDFVLYGTDTFFVFEVKNSNRIQLEDLRGIRAFSDDYPEAISVILYRGNERFKTGNTLVIPVSDFLMQLDPKKGIATAIE